MSFTGKFVGFGTLELCFCMVSSAGDFCPYAKISVVGGTGVRVDICDTGEAG